MPNIILYIAQSLDGYIAEPNDNLSFLKIVEDETEDYGYKAFYDTIDTIIIGKRTYDWIVKEVGYYPHLDRMNYVITHQNIESKKQLEFYHGDLTELISSLKCRVSDKNIFCNGGATLVNELLKLNLIDEIILSTVPVILGNGIRLFQEIIKPISLKLESTKTFSSGLVQQHFTLIKN